MRTLLAVSLLSVAGLTGCKKVAEALSEPAQTLKSADGTLEITVPGGWMKDKLNDQAVLQASNRAAELYVIVLSEAKEDLADMDLIKFSEITRGSQLQSMTNGVEEGPKNRTIAGMKAVEYVLRGTVEKANVVMKHVAIESPKSYHQVLVWTLKSKWESEQPGLDAIVESLKEASAAGRAPAPK